jgi:hypothetical protein
LILKHKKSLNFVNFTQKKFISLNLFFLNNFIDAVQHKLSSIWGGWVSKGLHSLKSLRGIGESLSLILEQSKKEGSREILDEWHSGGVNLSGKGGGVIE